MVSVKRAGRLRSATVRGEDAFHLARWKGCQNSDTAVFVHTSLLHATFHHRAPPPLRRVMVCFLSRDRRTGQDKEGIIPGQRLADYLFLMGAWLLWEMFFKHIRPVSTSVDFLGYQFVTRIAVHEALEPRFEGK